MRTRRPVLIAGGVFATGAVAWGLLAPPPLPALEAHRVGELVFLENPSGPMIDAVPFEVGSTGLSPAAAEPSVAITRAALEARTTAPVDGSAGPAVVAFTDYRCGICREHTPEWLARAERDEIRFVARDWPILTPESRLGARAALAAQAQGGYWTMHRALMATRFIPTMEIIRAFAVEHGLDPSRLERDMQRPEIETALAHNAALAQGVGARGTPVYVVDGVVVRGGHRVETILRLGRHHRRA